jgi:Trk K+ transport system NAD-binding subunit
VQPVNGFRIDDLQHRATRSQRLPKALWREWCFVRAILAHRGPSFLVLCGLLVLGGACFRVFEPEKQHSFWVSIYMTWSLVFGQPPEAFPASLPLRFLFFLVPVIGLTVILEAIVEISLMIRDRSRRAQDWCKIMAHSMHDHVILIGLGRLGLRTFHVLRKLGQDVVVIEKDDKNQFLDDVRREGSPLLIADARREAWLADAGVLRAKSILLATTDDLANLEIALDARRLNPAIHVVLRMFDPNMAEKVREGFQIQTSLSQATLAAPAFAAAALERSVVASQVLGGELVLTQRWKVPGGSALAGLSVGELLGRRRIGVLERRTQAGERSLLPPPEEHVEAGDVLLVQGCLETLASARRELAIQS